MPVPVDGLVFFALSLALFWVVQRWLHRELQAVLLLLTRNPSAAIGIFSLLFFPGVLLHETSHFLMARLLGVRTGKFSLIPQTTPQGSLRLGYVETARADWLRDTLIGMAPLLTGGVLIAWLGLSRLQLLPVGTAILTSNWKDLPGLLSGVFSVTDFWLWFYLAFAVSSTMLPSASDRQAWLPLGLVLLGLLIIAITAGAGMWMLENLAPGLNQILRGLSALFSVSLVVHLILGIPIWLFRLLICQMTGLQVV
ncbi:hypothetical protein LARV_02112 [Longilinea arvoryzae]|uniref:Uncharacterized protein n=1 Tax=Longilinea arvoryzae TaxID=360412 RepID=A0A0S7BJ08_9CHLR|nr:hypothetical protein [Longilinea arvoryzae]GAP14344.1 hypothetical protein LARV_02112 [Longilinea arvoryzae]